MLDRCADHRLRVGGGVRRWLRGVSPLRGASSTAAHVRLLGSTTTTRSSWQHGRHGRRVGRRLLEYRHGASYQLRLPVPSTVCSEPSLPFCFRAQLLNRLIKLTKFSDSIAEGTHLTSLKQVRRRRYEKSPLFEPQTSLEKKQATDEQTNRQTDRRTEGQHCRIMPPLLWARA